MSRSPPDYKKGQQPPRPYGHGQEIMMQQMEPNEKYGPGRMAPNQQYGPGQMAPNEKYGPGQMAPNQQYGQGQMAPNQQYGPDQMAPNQQYGPGQMAPPQHWGPPPQPLQQQQSNTTVVINQPGSVQNFRILGPRDGHRDWNSSLFSCCDDVGKCMWVMFCPNCVVRDISARLGECDCVTCCIPGGLATMRTRLRTLGGIRGSICMDYLATEFCQPCVLCQMHRELDYMGL